MSTEETAAALNEVPNKSVMGLIWGMAIKYGLPSICCIWLFYVIKCKDEQIFTMAQNVTTALVESTHAKAEGNEAINRLATAVDKLANQTR